MRKCCISSRCSPRWVMGETVTVLLSHLDVATITLTMLLLLHYLEPGKFPHMCCYDITVNSCKVSQLIGDTCDPLNITKISTAI